LKPSDGVVATVPSRNRRPRSPRAALERLVATRPPRIRDRTLDAAVSDPAVVTPLPRSAAVEVACWTPIDGTSAASAGNEPRATILADSSGPDGTDAPVSHTLVLEVDTPTRSVGVDYHALETSVVPDRGVRVRTDDGDRVAVTGAHRAPDGTFVVTPAEPRTDGALFVEYDVSRNPSGGRHTVGVVVDGEFETEARLVVVG
jgi:hypothetical protein